MKRQQLGETGVEVSRVGLGCAMFGREVDQAVSFALMDYAIANDITLFDTAEAYGGGQARDYRRTQLKIDDTREVSGEYHSSEKIIGRWLRATSLRNQIFLISKVTTNFSRRHVLEALQASLERLNTDHLDLYLFHNFDQQTPLEEALEAMEEVKSAGLTRFVGCSNFTAEQTRQAWALGERCGAGLDAVEAVCNLALRDAEQDLLPFCAQKGLGFLAYSPFAAGFLTGKYSGNRSQMPAGSRFHVIPGHADIYFNERSFQALAELQALERELGIPAVQLAIAWVLAHSAVTSVLCGARAIAHLENALAAMNFQLPAHWKWPALLKNGTMLIIDAHLDLSWNAVGWNRDLTQSIGDIRAAEAQIVGKGRGCGTVSFPEMRKGQIGISLATVLARCNPNGRSSIDFRTQEIACATAQGQLAYYRLLERRGYCRMIRSRSALDNSFAEWQATPQDAPFGLILSMEGADPILYPEHAADWFEDGLRVVGLAHYGPSAYAHGTGSSGGLTEGGRQLLRVMEQLGMILDLTHLADESFLEAAELFGGAVLASHNNCRSLAHDGRQFSDEQIRLIIQRQGVIGTAFDAWMLVPGWRKDSSTNPQVTLEDAVRHMDHICQIAGNTRHVAIGSDLDGGFGTEQCPEDLDTIAGLQNLAPLLHKRGYSNDDVRAIFHGNWMRLFTKAWKCL